jgi:dynein light chain LC8-type
MSEQRKAVIKNADMSEEMQQDAVDCAAQALSMYNIEKVGVSLKLNEYVSFDSFMFHLSLSTNELVCYFEQYIF